MRLTRLTIPPPPGSESSSEDEEPEQLPDFGSLDYIYHFSRKEGRLPTPIDVSITGSTMYICPELKWYNFDVYPHKVKLTNTGYTVLLGAKWRTERPYLEGGPFYEKHVLSQVHFHWGPNFMSGSEHTVDKRRHPGEMQVIFFRSEYMTQQEALLHPDGVVMICYLIKYGVKPDERLAWIIEGFQRIREAQSSTRIGPYPMSRLLPMFYEDYFLYWGTLPTVKGEKHVIRWLVPRITLFASTEQMTGYIADCLKGSISICRRSSKKIYPATDLCSVMWANHLLRYHEEFRKLWDPWDEPNLGNSRPLQERRKRHVFLINPHWNLYNSLLPISRVPEESISVLSSAYQANPWMLPPQNRVQEELKEIDKNKNEQC